MAEVPQTRYTRLGEDRIAYQVVGEGPVDLLFTPASSDCIDIRWDWPPYASFLRRLASFSRLIMFDRRGYGASDSVSGATLPEYERWADDARAVLDASGSEQAAIYGASDSGPIAILFAAVEPERTQALILGNATARFVIEDDYPSGLTKADIDGAVQVLEEI